MLKILQNRLNEVGKIIGKFLFLVFLNPLPPSDAVRKQTFILEDLFSSVLSQFKNSHPSGNLKFKILGIFQS